MNVARGSATLNGILALRMILVSAFAMLLLFGYFFLRYTADARELRLSTLKADLEVLQAEIIAGRDPANLPQYRRTPPAYAFRAFDRRSSDARKVFAQAHPELFTLGLSTSHADASDPPDLAERFDEYQITHAGVVQPLSILTDRVTSGNRAMWLQVAMLDDPDRHWIGVIRSEMIDHVGVPALVFIPLLALAMFAATRSAIRPLQSIAAQAAALGHAVGSGGHLEPLPTRGLPAEFKTVVDALNAMLARLEASMLRQRQFTANAAHEIRTPLSVMLLEIAHLPDSPAKDQMTAELKSLRQTVHQLLRFAQAEDAMSGERQQVDVAAVARQVCEDMANKALDTGREIEFIAAIGPAVTRGNAELVDVAIRNLVDNALRHTPPGGTVTVTVLQDPGVRVEDTGPGVLDVHKPLIFERFWRADRSLLEGAGIGLALARQIAQLHGGDIVVSDRAGAGARFELRFAPHNTLKAAAPQRQRGVSEQA